MIAGQKFRTKDAERGSCSLFVENTFNGHFVVGGADAEMIKLTASFLNNVCAAPGKKLDMTKNNLGYEPGVVLDKLITKAVFEWDVQEGDQTDWNPRGLYSINPRVWDDVWHDLPYFSTRISDGWLVNEHMIRRAEKHPAGKMGSPEWRSYVAHMQFIQCWQLDSSDMAFTLCVAAAEALKTTL